MNSIVKKQDVERFLFTRTALSLEDERNHSFAIKPVSEKNVVPLQLTKPLVHISDAELGNRIEWKCITSQHFILNFDAYSFHPKEADVLLQRLEDFYRHIYSITHESFADAILVNAVDVHSPTLNGRTARTHFNAGERTIYLVRNGSESIESELIIALTHAMRYLRYLSHYGITRGWAMLEDGFGVFLSERCSGGKPTFPFFGVDPNVVAHFLKECGAVRMLSSVWTARSFATPLERYALAGAFLLHLGDVLGDDKVTAFARHDDETSSRTFETYFGASLDKLEERWIEHLPHSFIYYTEDELHEQLSSWKHAVDGKF